MKPSHAVLMTAAALALSACSSNTRWEPSVTYQPAQRVKPSPADLLPTYEQKLAQKQKRGLRLSGAAAIANANKANVRDVGPGEMCGFAWCIERFDTNTLHIVRLKNGELHTIVFPPNEKVEGEFFGSIADAFDEGSIAKAYSGGRGSLTIRPVNLTKASDVEIVTSENPYRFRFVPSDSFLRKVVIQSAADGTGSASFAADAKPESVTPRGPFEKLTVIPLDTNELPPGAPFNAWADRYKMVVELNPDFPLPVFLAGKKGDAVVQYSTHEYTSRSGQKVVAYVTRRPITEAMLHGDGWRILLTAHPEEHGIASFKSGPWRDAASLPDPDLAAEEVPQRRSLVQPADVPLDGRGVMGDEIDRIIQENNRHKKPIDGPPPAGIPVEEVI